MVSRHEGASNLIIRRLIEKGARVSTGTYEGNTLLHLACKNENTDSLIVLLTSGANSIQCDESGANALHYTARYGK
ncbi:uncharacterized protein B0J16DRAFT_336223 [Fusarium flagelliforme]|uniref:uncharacterized protein n=1 Tax=Fusarium flagelliforme TaxID=2675880 RepID=UPI001E8D5498|nr:uncharacterized protein B0J16DRAFT_336223 [Fusarium flagelliforme]KAH7193902.1 hypothetical protein B0J16DRAFT_336223 [Fusarium flagelliforme]